MAKIGDVFSIPLGDDRVAIGQIVAKKTTPAPCLILVCRDTFPASKMPSPDELHQCVHSLPIILANSFDVLVDSGDWKKLANIPPLGTLKLPAFRNIIGGLPFGFTVTSFDLSNSRLAVRPREMFAPSYYSISPKWLEDVVKSFFGRGKWNVKHDKLLYKNIIPFGKSHDRHLPPEPPLGHMVFAKIMDSEVASI